MLVQKRRGLLPNITSQELPAGCRHYLVHFSYSNDELAPELDVHGRNMEVVSRWRSNRRKMTTEEDM